MFEFTEVRDPRTTMVSLSEIVLYDIDDTVIDISSVYNRGGVYANLYEYPDALVDRNLYTKWVDINFFGRSTVELWVTSPQHAYRYEFYTSVGKHTSNPRRDPVAWRFGVLHQDGHFEVLSIANHETPPLARSSSYGNYTVHRRVEPFGTTASGLYEHFYPTPLRITISDTLDDVSRSGDTAVHASTWYRMTVHTPKAWGETLVYFGLEADCNYEHATRHGTWRLVSEQANHSKSVYAGSMLYRFDTVGRYTPCVVEAYPTKDRGHPHQSANDTRWTVACYRIGIDCIGGCMHGCDTPAKGAPACVRMCKATCGRLSLTCSRSATVRGVRAVTLHATA